ncbi:MAG: hypothetical protein K2W88_08390 [Pararheinheimera sp.]|nr:hypothetical protein [Rheinheimera sp.]
MAGFQPPPRVKTALDNRKLNLSTPCPTDPKKKSNLTWGLYTGNPRITVYTGDAENSKVSAAMDIIVFQSLLNLMKKALTAPAGWKDAVVNSNYTWFNRVKSATPEVVSKVHVGKDTEGQIWISVTDTKATKVRFFIGAPDFHSFEHGDGTPFTKEETSVLCTEAYVNVLERVTANLFVNAWPEVEADYKKRADEAAAKREGSGGGSYSRQAPADKSNVAEGDIPW